MKTDSKRDFLLRWATIASGSAALTDAEIAAVAGGIAVTPLYGVRVPTPTPTPPHGHRPFPVPPHPVPEYGPISPAI